MNKTFAPSALLLFLMSPHAAAASPAPSPASGIAQMLFGLLVVIFLLVGALKLLRKLQQKAGAGVHQPKVLGAAAVGPRERVVLVSIAGKVLVLGVAPGRVTPLHTLDAAELPSAPAAGNAAPASDFALRLKQLMERARHGK